MRQFLRVVLPIVMLVIAVVLTGCSSIDGDPDYDNIHDPYNPESTPQIHGINFSKGQEITNLDEISVYYATSAVLDMQVSLVEAEGMEPSGEWHSMDNLINYINVPLNVPEGEYFIAARGRNAFDAISGIYYQGIFVDRTAAIDTFYWDTPSEHQSPNDTLAPGDTIDFFLQVQQDNFGYEEQGSAAVHIADWPAFRLDHVENGVYRRSLILDRTLRRTADEPVILCYEDYAGNVVPDYTAAETLTAWWTPAGEVQNFPLGNSGEEISMVYIPAGTFMMGSEEGEPGADPDEYPRHQVTITRPYWISQYEVTRNQWLAIADHYHFSQDEDEDYPANCLSWENVNTDFLPNLNASEGNDLWRLPTEAEWEYACRAGNDTTRFWWGNDGGYTQVDQYAWYFDNANYDIHPVGSLDPNPWNLYDMHGNVAEWCSDFYQNYYESSDPVVDPTGPETGDYHCSRGGHNRSYISHMRSANRYFEYYGEIETQGMRLVRIIEE